MSETTILNAQGKPFLRSESRSLTTNEAFDQFELLTGLRSIAGVTVNRESALSLSAVWRAVSIISRGIGKTPFLTYERTEDGKKRAREHPLYNLLRYKPNDEMTAFVFWQAIMVHVLIGDGNGYAYIDLSPSGKVTQLILLDAENVTPIRLNGDLWYAYDFDSQTRLLNPRRVLHIRGMGFDGLRGVNPLKNHKETIASGLTFREHGQRFFRNGTRPGVMLEHPGIMEDAAQRRFLHAWNNNWTGLENAHKTIILEQGMKATTLNLSARDAQMIEAAVHNVREIANIFGVPAHKLGDTTKTSYNSLENEKQSELDDAYDPWMVNIEQECRDKLLSKAEKQDDSVVLEFHRDALIRVDLKTQNEAFAKATAGAAWMTQNDVRRAKNLPPVEGGDVLHGPNNTPKPAPSEGGGDEVSDDRTNAAIETVFRDAARRARRRVAACARAAAKHSRTFPDWLESVRSKHLRPTTETLLPAAGVVAAARGQNGAEVLTTAVESVLSRAQEVCDEIYSTTTPDNFQEALDSALTEWEGESDG